MVEEIIRRSEILYRDVVRMHPSTYRQLFKDFEIDVKEILLESDVMVTPIHERLSSLFRSCCIAFGVNEADVLQARKSTGSSMYALTAFMKLAMIKYGNREEALRFIGKSRQYYYKSMEKFDDLIDSNKTFIKIYNNICHESRDIEID